MNCTEPFDVGTQPSLTVIIVNWNGGSLLDDCLTQLSRQTRTPDRVLLMDNGSTDGSAARAALFPSVTVRLLGENLGFAAANNRALAECDTDFVALLNPDAIPDTNWLEMLMEAADQNPRVAAFGSKQMMAGQVGILDGIGDAYHMSGMVWRNGYGRAERTSDNIAREIFSACAGAALYRRDALMEAGAFDEDYFCYVEDVDLGFRLRLLGKSCMYIPTAVVSHVGSASAGGRRSDFSVYFGRRNLIWTFIKNMPGPLLLLFLPLHILMNAASIIRFVLLGRGKSILRAELDAVSGIPKMWRKRIDIQRRRTISTMKVWRTLDKRFIPTR